MRIVASALDTTPATFRRRFNDDDASRMTTNTRIVAAKDLFIDNDVFRLWRSQYPSTSDIGGVAWLRQEPPRRAHLMALNTAVAAIRRALPTYRLSLLVAHTALQPHSAVARYRRLWSSLEVRGMRLPQGARTQERATEEADGIRWRGAIMLDGEAAPQAMEVIEAESASALVAAPASVLATLDGLIAGGWAPSRQGPPSAILDWVCSNDGVVFWPVGAFDDAESGIVAFSSPGVVELLGILA